MSDEDNVFLIDPELVRIDENGVEVWDGEKYVRREVWVVKQEDGLFLLEILPVL